MMVSTRDTDECNRVVIYIQLKIGLDAMKNGMLAMLLSTACYHIFATISTAGACIRWLSWMVTRWSGPHLQEASELGVTVGDVAALAVHQCRDDISQRRQREVNLDTLLQPITWTGRAARGAIIVRYDTDVSLACVQRLLEN